MQLLKIKEVGIISGYVSLLIGIFFFEIRPFIIFLGVVVEFFVLLIIFLLVNILRKDKPKSNDPPLVNILAAGLALGAFQGLILSVYGLGLESFDQRQQDEENLIWNILALAVPLFVFNMAGIFKKKFDAFLIADLRKNLFTNAFAFTGIIFSIILIHELIEDEAPGLSVSIVAGSRVIFELWMNHFQKSKVPNKIK
ncbi:MAG: hypothetical protein IPM77_06845 [Crocinitomicaceae bacterium]|nr:hypothetical protein [Crocinitomicaceae bacterium]